MGILTFLQTFKEILYGNRNGSLNSLNLCFLESLSQFFIFRKMRMGHFMLLTVCNA